MKTELTITIDIPEDWDPAAAFDKCVILPASVGALELYASCTTVEAQESLEICNQVLSSVEIQQYQKGSEVPHGEDTTTADGERK